jgi:hypothetical protein
LQRTIETRKLLIFIVAAVVTFLLGPRSIPVMGEDGLLEMTFMGAIFWWTCTIAFIVLIILIIRQLTVLSKIARYRPAR